MVGKGVREGAEEASGIPSLLLLSSSSSGSSVIVSFRFGVGGSALSAMALSV